MRATTTAWLIPAVLLAWAAAPEPALAERDRLYSRPDPACPGGLRGNVTSPARPLVQVLAIPPDEPRLVYEGAITGPNRRGFLFQGLPMRRYDLVVILEDRFYEGLTLHRGENTLTTEDRAAIDRIVQESEPYFTRKVIHRAEGETGRGNFARCICTFLRDKPSKGNPRHRRTFKLLVLKDVGPGWQFVRSRDLYPLFVDPGQTLPRHAFREAIAGVRVTDHMKDLGNINLADTAPRHTGRGE